MSKLPRNVKGKQLIRALQKIGFVKTGTKGSHVRLEHPDGRWTLWLYTPNRFRQAHFVRFCGKRISL